MHDLHYELSTFSLPNQQAMKEFLFSGSISNGKKGDEELSTSQSQQYSELKQNVVQLEEKLDKMNENWTEMQKLLSKHILKGSENKEGVDDRKKWYTI